MRPVQFTSRPPHGDRVHFIAADDVRTLLSRLPGDVWRDLRAVHFNDLGWHIGVPHCPRELSYADPKAGEIALCAWPPRCGLTQLCLRYGGSPEKFGGRRNGLWSTTAVRRYFLYNLVLREIGHLQLVEPWSKSRLRFAKKARAHGFARCWRRRLWSQPFDHPDPAHNPPSAEELAQLREA